MDKNNKDGKLIWDDFSDEDRAELAQLEKEFPFEEFKKDLEEKMDVLHTKLSKYAERQIDSVMKHQYQVSRAKYKRLLKKSNKYPQALTRDEEMKIHLYNVMYLEVKSQYIEKKVKKNDNTNKSTGKEKSNGQD